MKRYLIIKPSSLGDILHAFPAVYALLHAENDTHVDWVINPAFADLMEYLPGVENRIFFRRKELGQLKTFFPVSFQLLRDLRKEYYDAVIDLQGLTRSALIAILARGRQTCGPASAKELPARFCYRGKLHFPETVKHAQERNCAMMSDFLHGKNVTQEYHLPEVQKFAESAEHLLAEKGISKTERFIVIAPGARWETKEWPAEFFAEAAMLIARKLPDVPFVLSGSSAEQVLCTRIEKFLSGKVNCCNLCGFTGAGELIEVIRRASVLICNDSGPMHAAAAVCTPLVAMFGPTDPELTGPYGKNCCVLRPELSCLRCFNKQCESMKCHAGIPTEMVSEAVIKLWNCKGERV